MKHDTAQTILLVDDEESILKSLRRLLADIPIEVLSATGGAEALELIKEHNVSLIISDQRMPEMTGVEMLKRSREISPDTVRILLTGYADITATVDAINDGAIAYYFNKPWDDELLLSRIKESLDIHAVRAENKWLQELTRKQNKKLKELNASLEERVEEQTSEIREQHEELKRSFMETIKAFSTIVELRFQDVGSHSQRVAALVKRMLQNFDLSPQEYQDIIVAAYLHDIGKISFPDRILARDPDKYNTSDLELVQKHPILGQSCICHINDFEEVGVLIRNHHENYDGSGYPDKLVENQIPIGSMLIRIADTFDHLAFAKGYPTLSVINEASAYLVQHSGTKFNPKLISKFIECDAAREFLFKESSAISEKDPAELREGMVVACDVNTKNGMFLVPKGAKLSRGMIGRICKINKVDPVTERIQVYKKNYSTEEKTGYVPV